MEPIVLGQTRRIVSASSDAGARPGPKSETCIEPEACSGGLMVGIIHYAAGRRHELTKSARHENTPAGRSRSRGGIGRCARSADRRHRTSGKNGRIVYANEALRAFAARGHDFRIDRDIVEFSTADLRSRFAGALSAVERIQDPQAATGRTDFAVPRDHGLPAYTVSVRPLMRDRPQATDSAHAVAMLLIHDPCSEMSRRA